MSETTNNPPTFTEKQKPDWRTGKSPLNVRPRGEQISFVEKLITHKGSAQAALSHCIDVAMGPIVTTTDGKAEIERLKKENKMMEATIIKDGARILQLEHDLKSLRNITAKEGSIAPGPVTEQLAKIQKKKKLHTTGQAIEYCINYTIKNDWL